MIPCNNYGVRRKEDKCVEKKEDDLLWRWKVFRKSEEALAWKSYEKKKKLVTQCRSTTRMIQKGLL